MPENGSVHDLHISLLGPVQARVGGHQINVPSRLQRAVLAYLALSAGRVVSSARLIDALWGEKAPATVVGTLQVHVSRLRRILGPAAHLLVTQPPGYVLLIPEENVDLLAFETSVRAGTSGTEGLMPVDISDADGDVLADLVDVPFVPDVVARIRELRWAMMEDQVERALTAGRHVEVIADVERMLAAQPYREGLWRVLMVALYRSDRQADALDAYRRAARILSDDLGLDPGSALKVTHQAVLVRDSTLYRAREPVVGPALALAEAPRPPAREAPAKVWAEGHRHVVVLQTEVVDPTPLWQRHAAVMPAVLARYHDLVEESVRAKGGLLPADQGGSTSRLGVFEGFDAITDAARAALTILAAVAAEPWPQALQIGVRTGIDHGDVLIHRGNVFGVVVSRGSQVRALANPGQIVVHAEQPHRSTDVQWTELGLHLLPDMPGRIPLLQADGPGDAQMFPPLRSAGYAVAPAVPDGFVGRTEEVRACAAAVGVRSLVTVTAPGGTGKTSVAIAVAHDFNPRFPGGAVFVDLAAVLDAAHVGTAVALAFGLTEVGSKPWAAVAGLTAGRSTLVVLDNCEQVAGLAELLSGQLTAAPEIGWLATSRVPIGLPREQVIALGPLQVPLADTADEAALISSPAGALLLSRARQASPGLAVDAPAIRTLAAIARRLDGHPLAIELAAARLRFQSGTAVLRGLQATLADLRDVSGRGDPRRQELGAVLSWSIDRLDDSAAGLLDGLAVFQTSTTVAAMADVAGLDEPSSFASLSRLLDAGLARAVPFDIEPRFDVLTPVREHVRRGWTTGRRDELRNRHAHYHAGWAARGSVDLHNTEQDSIWVSDSLAARPDALAALDHLRNNNTAAAVRMACHLMVLWEEHDDEERGIELLSELSAAATEDDEPYRSLARLLAVHLSGSRADELEVAAACADVVALGSPQMQAKALLERAFSELVHDRVAAGLADLQAAHSLAQTAAAIEATGSKPLTGLTRAATTLFSAGSVLARYARWRTPAEFLRINEEGLRDCGGPGNFAFVTLVCEVFRAQAETGRLDAAHRTAQIAETVTMTVGARGFHVILLPAAMLATRERRDADALALVARYRATQSLVHADVLEAAALGADVMIAAGQPERALRELDCVAGYPTNSYRSIASARRARALVELGDLTQAEAVLDETAGELASGEASPGALTYWVTRALLAHGDRRTECLAEYDLLVSSTGVNPWPRDAADRARLA